MGLTSCKSKANIVEKQKNEIEINGIDKVSKQSVTFLGGIGYNWNSYKSIESNNNLIYNPFYGLNKEGINYIHTSVQYKYVHWILGYAVTSQNNFTKNGLTLGFQNKKCRTFANIGLLNKKKN